MSERRSGNDYLGAILSRIDQRLQRERITDRAASLRAGLSAGQIRSMRRQHRLGQQRGASLHTMTRLAAALNTTPEWLTSGIGPEERRPNHSLPRAGLALPLAGSVAAGVWTEPSDMVDPQPSPVPPDPRYPPSWQRAYEVRGNSIDRIARPGDFLVVVDKVAAGLSARPSDIVIITRKKEGLREVTARRLAGGPDCLLVFDSTDVRYKGMELSLRSLLAPSNQPDAGNVVGGFVIGVYRPLMI
jgi:hypothetical protein